MQLEHYSVEELKAQITRIFEEYLDMKLYRAFFFGSRVRGNNSERADIDLGIEGPNRLPPKLKVEIQEELDRLPILYEIDFVDFQDVSSQFKKEALRYKEYVN